MSVELKIKKLKFDLPDGLMVPYCKEMVKQTERIREISKRSGTGSDKFKAVFQELLAVIKYGGNISDALKVALDLRALAIALKTAEARNVRLDYRVFEKINSIRDKPSSLLVESVYSHYLSYYDKLDDLTAVESWLRTAMEKRGQLDSNTTQILGGRGPKWLAESCHEQHVDFDVHVGRVGLGSYLSGRFLQNAKNIYYLETLRNLKPDEASDILDEVQKREVFESRYDEKSLLGHEILKILISRADDEKIPDRWMNVIMAIAGDPRVSTRSERYVRWWSQISSDHISKVRGWLSKLDLRLFLDALKDFSNQPGKDDLRRMYPSRKKFLEGLLEQKLVIGTRLFVTYEAKAYLEKQYKKEHLPSFSIVEGGGAKPLIYISLSRAHVVEGTHSCKFWVYRKLKGTAAVFNYDKQSFVYRDLTAGMDEQMWGVQSEGSYAAVQHSGQWQVKAAIALKELGVQIDASRLLTKEDYQSYKYSGYL